MFCVITSTWPIHTDTLYSIQDFIMDVRVLVHVGAVTLMWWKWENPLYTHVQYLVTIPRIYSCYPWTILNRFLIYLCRWYIAKGDVLKGLEPRRCVEDELLQSGIGFWDRVWWVWRVWRGSRLDMWIKDRGCIEFVLEWSFDDWSKSCQDCYQTIVTYP